MKNLAVQELSQEFETSMQKEIDNMSSSLEEIELSTDEKCITLNVMEGMKKALRMFIDSKEKILLKSHV